MKICLFNNVFPPVTSGSSHFVNDLAQRLVKRGHKVAVITSRFPGTKKEETINGVKVFRLPCLRLPKTKLTLNYGFITYTFLPWNVKRIYQIIRKYKFDILQVHGQIFDLFISGVLAKKKFKIPLVLSIHTYVMHTNKFYNKVLGFLDRTFVRRLVKNCDAIIAGEKNTVKYVKQRYHKKCWQATGIISPIDVKRKVKFDALKKWKLSKKNKVIVSLGHVHNLRKRINLIKALPIILKKFPSTKILVLGDVYIDEPKNLAKKLGVEKSIIFCGRVKHEEIYSYMKIADLEAHGLDLSFGFSKSSMEAMHAGKAVIVAVEQDYFGKNILKNWKNVVIVPKGNHKEIAKAILRLLKNKKLRESIGKKGAKLMKAKFTWNHTCESFEKLYEQLLRKKKS